jgi:hypothetical protein
VRAAAYGKSFRDERCPQLARLATAVRPPTAKEYSRPQADRRQRPLRGLLLEIQILWRWGQFLRIGTRKDSWGDLFGMRWVIGTDDIDTNVVNPNRPSAYHLHSIRERRGAVGDVDGDFDFLPGSVSFDKTLRRSSAKTIAKRDRRTVDIVRTDPKTSALSNLIASQEGSHLEALASIGCCG